MGTVIAFDQATVTSGYSIYSDGKYIESGIIKKSSKVPIDIRTQDMAKSICQKIKEVNPNLVIIEGIQDQNSIATVIQLGRLQGAIMFYCANKGIQIEVIGPSSWRAALEYRQGRGVKRDSLKQQSVDYVKNQLKLKVESIDECEAICINIAAQKLWGV